MHPSSSLRKAGRLRLAVPIAVSILAAACGNGGGKPGVGVRDVSADITFGLKAAGDKAGSEIVNPTAVSTEIDNDEHVALAPLPDSSGRKKRLGPSLRIAEDCPNATANDFAEKEAPLFSDTTPNAGLYRWKLGGDQELVVLPGQKLPYGGFEDRIIQNVQVTSDTVSPVDGSRNLEYTYEMVLPNQFTGGTTTLFFQVKTNSEAQREVNNSNTGARVRAGEFERGLVIKRRVDTNQHGDVENDYVYSTGLLLLPLPVSPGEDFSSTAVTNRREAASYTAKVGTKQIIDACGDIIEGWEVKGTLRDPDGQVSAYNIIVATQYGVVLIDEAYEWTNSAGTFRPRFTLGQLKPSPPPAADQT